MEGSKTGIHEALANVMLDVDHVAKRDRNSHQNFTFRGIDAVVNAVGPALRKNKVIVVPQVQSCNYELVQTTTGKNTTSCRMIVDYTFYAEDGSFIVARVAAEAFDSGDKATPKAMSVAFRTALLQALALPTDEPDPDSQSYERVSEAAVPTRRAARSRAARDVAAVNVPTQETGVPTRAFDFTEVAMAIDATDSMDALKAIYDRSVPHLDVQFTLNDRTTTLRTLVLEQKAELEGRL